MPLLRNLTFGPTGYPDEEPPTPLTLFDGAPKLCAIELGYNFAPWSTRLPWSQLTTLTARALFEYECISILQQAPALVHFQTTFCDSSSDQAARAEAEDIPPLRHLMSLVLCGNICPDDTHKHMLEKLTLPELRTLEISELWLGTNADPCAIILSFIAKSRCTLDKLRITDARTPELAYREVFPSIPEISLSR
ncbi:hypothetical protein C8R44DRAFT_797158 [Mycena epipterygia]|nr:hypothetical protein C8R44DRAFT_797158 [Mycena epipterygia]